MVTKLLERFLIVQGEWSPWFCKVRDNVRQYARRVVCFYFYHMGNVAWHLDGWDRAVGDLGRKERRENKYWMLQTWRSSRGKVLRPGWKCPLPRLGGSQVCMDMSKGNYNTWAQKTKNPKPSDVQSWRSPPRMARRCLVGTRGWSSSFCSVQIIPRQKTWQPCSPHCS